MQNIHNQGGLTGVYAIVYLPTWQMYIGSSKRSIGNRLSWHVSALKGGYHTSPLLQENWDSGVPEDFEVFILEECEPALCREREAYWAGEFFDVLLNEQPPHEKRKMSPATRQKQSESRPRYLETPGAREILSQNAKKQHADGNFGRATWRS